MAAPTIQVKPSQVKSSERWPEGEIEFFSFVTVSATRCVFFGEKKIINKK